MRGWLVRRCVLPQESILRAIKLDGMWCPSTNPDDFWLRPLASRISWVYCFRKGPRDPVADALALPEPPFAARTPGKASSARHKAKQRQAIAAARKSWRTADAARRHRAAWLHHVSGNLYRRSSVDDRRRVRVWDRGTAKAGWVRLCAYMYGDVVCKPDSDSDDYNFDPDSHDESSSWESDDDEDDDESHDSDYGFDSARRHRLRLRAARGGGASPPPPPSLVLSMILGLCVPTSALYMPLSPPPSSSLHVAPSAPCRPLRHVRPRPHSQPPPPLTAAPDLCQHLTSPPTRLMAVSQSLQRAPATHPPARRRPGGLAAAATSA